MADGGVTAPRAAGVGDRIVFLGHATVLIELDGVRLLSDPALRSRMAHLRRRSAAVDASATANLDAVLISHLHHDHLDLASLRLVGRDTPLLVPAGAAAWLRRRRFSSVRELAVGEAANVGSLEVQAVEARHDGRRAGGPRAQAVGFVVRARRTVYFAGDTECFSGMQELAPRLDVALLPVAGWGPTLGPGHMDPLQAARAAALLAPRVAIPIHWGTFSPVGVGRRHASMLRDPPRLFAEHVAGLAPGIDVRILQPGQGTTL
jgi:L-ascorbate metabolism protein UlaG (beta-lactamase superfamily)